ncbi:F390 synthetase-related protein [Paenibacillus caui]|uniref:F390 synthetase-related protein n=1 Tax=Paenibacillus caui TaxID=2873927 RepID=UPI001CA87640|nr:F390 synthetase-related protein [Paenibacillus caui]
MDNLGLLLTSYMKYKYLYHFKNRDRFEQWQSRRIKRFLKNIIPKSRFYSSFYKGLNIEDWQQLPTINKQIMMDHFDQLNLYGIKKEEAFKIAFEAEKSRDFSPQLGDVTIGLSSGTSGNRGLFLVNSKERAVWAGAILAKVLPDGLFAQERVAFFLRANSNLYETVHSKRIQFKFYDILYPVEKHVEELNSYQPTILAAPPSILTKLAHKIQQGQLFIHCKKVISVAEVLEPIDERFIQEQFKQTVHQVYQATEGFLATTCKYGTLHLNEDIISIQKEYIDMESGRFMPIITDFTRTSQPIIRYRLNDILTERKDPCPCGSCFTAIHSIEGRTDDIFYLRSKTDDQFIEIFPDFIRREVMMTSNQIKEYQVDQTSPDVIELYLNFGDHCKNESIVAALISNLTRLFTSMNCIVPNMVFMGEISEQSSGKKLRRVQRKFLLE